MFKNQVISLPSPCPKGLSITRDDAGVPHIQANNRVDLNWGLGYCHALDRGMQLQLMRVIGQGRLCELLDDSDDNFAIDVFFRRMNWSYNAHKELDKLNSETREWCQALCDGINAGLAQKKLSVLSLMGLKAEPWRITDIILCMRMTSYLTLAQSQAEVEKLFIELAQSGISMELLAEIFPIDTNEIDTDLLQKITLSERIPVLEKLWQSAAHRSMASNNWVVSGSHTQSGAAMLANDPHLEVNRLPNVFYEAVLNSPEYAGMGFGIPGLPGLLIGRTADISWGTTYAFMDTVDHWVEHCKDGKFRRGKSWRRFDTREELIKRKKSADQSITFYENLHGVLDGSPDEESYLLCSAWSMAQTGATSLNASYSLSHAGNAEQALESLGKIESAWNWVVCDTQGNIGYQMSGLAPKRKESWNGFSPAPGWDKDYDWRGFHSPKDLPRCFNPESGIIVTANEDRNHLGKVSSINMPMGDYRAKRIEDLLRAQDQHEVSSFARIQMDTYSLQAEAYTALLMPWLKEENVDSAAAKILEVWDFRYDAHSPAAVLFEVFYRELRDEVFAHEQLPKAALKHLSDKTGLFIDFYQNFDRCLLNPDSGWYAEKSQKQAFINAFHRAVGQFDHHDWGHINTFRFTNILFQGKLPEWTGVDSAEQAMIGGRATPHQGQIYESAGRKTSFAAAIRMVADMKESVLHTCMAGGPSEQRFSPWYRSEVENWKTGRLKVTKP